MAIISAKEMSEIFKQRPKEYEGGYIYAPISGKTPPPPSAKAALQQMKHSIATKEETAAFWKERKERFGDGAVISIPIMSKRRTPSPAWPDRGYLLTCEEGSRVWPHLKASLKRDGYEPLDSSHLKENEDE